MDLLLNDEDWEKINKKAKDDVLDMVVDSTHGKTRPVELAEKIVKRCNLTAEAQLKKIQDWFEPRIHPTTKALPVDTVFVIIKLDDILEFLGIDDLGWQTILEGRL